jgi:hypothetical protein
MWGLKQITSSWWFLYNKPHDQHLGHRQPYTSITISSTVHDGSRTANTREWMIMMKKQLKAWSNVKSSCIFLKNKPSIPNWYDLTTSILNMLNILCYTFRWMWLRNKHSTHWKDSPVLHSNTTMSPLFTTLLCTIPQYPYLKLILKMNTKAWMFRSQLCEKWWMYVVQMWIQTASITACKDFQSICSKIQSLNQQKKKKTLFITTGPWKVNAICVKKYTQNN